MVTSIQAEMLPISFTALMDYRRLFMGTRYAAFYYPTKTAGGKVTINL